MSVIWMENEAILKNSPKHFAKLTYDFRDRENF